MNKARGKARDAKAKQELIQISKAIITAESESGITLNQMIVNSGMASLAGRNSCLGLNLKSIPENHSCRVVNGLILGLLESNSNGLNQGLSNIKTDPWGSPYLISDYQRPGYPCYRNTVTSVRNIDLASFGIQHGTSYYSGASPNPLSGIITQDVVDDDMNIFVPRSHKLDNTVCS